MKENVVRQMQTALEKIKKEYEISENIDKAIISAINEGIVIGKQISETTKIYLNSAAERLEEAIKILNIQ